MCKCTPLIRTPFCGKLGCEWPTILVHPEVLREGKGVLIGVKIKDGKNFYELPKQEGEKMDTVIINNIECA